MTSPRRTCGSGGAVGRGRRGGRRAVPRERDVGEEHRVEAHACVHGVVAPARTLLSQHHLAAAPPRHPLVRLTSRGAAEMGGLVEKARLHPGREHDAFEHVAPRRRRANLFVACDGRATPECTQSGFRRTAVMRCLHDGGNKGVGPPWVKKVSSKRRGGDVDRSELTDKADGRVGKNGLGPKNGLEQEHRERDVHQMGAHE